MKGTDCSALTRIDMIKERSTSFHNLVRKTFLLSMRRKAVVLGDQLTGRSNALIPDSSAPSDVGRKHNKVNEVTFRDTLV